MELLIAQLAVMKFFSGNAKKLNAGYFWFLKAVAICDHRRKLT